MGILRHQTWAEWPEPGGGRLLDQWMAGGLGVEFHGLGAAERARGRSPAFRCVAPWPGILAGRPG